MNSLPIEAISEIFRLAVDSSHITNRVQTYRNAYCRIQKSWQRAATLVLHSEVQVQSDCSEDDISTVERLLLRCSEDQELGAVTVAFHLHMYEMDGDEDDDVRSGAHGGWQA